MKSALIPLALLITCSPAFAAPQDGLLELGTQDVAKAADIDAGDLLKAIPKAAKLLVNTRQEARALAALTLAYGKSASRPLSEHVPGTAETVIAFPLAMIADSEVNGRRIGGPPGPVPQFDDRNYSGPSRQEYQAAEAKAGRERAALAVHLTEQAGGCAGPMVDLLSRMRAQDHSSGTAAKHSAAGFARAVLTDLGRTVYPPDRSCE